MVTDDKANAIGMQIYCKSILVKPFAVREHVCQLVRILQLVDVIVVVLAVLAKVRTWLQAFNYIMPNCIANCRVNYGSLEGFERKKCVNCLLEAIVSEFLR
jgi:hypothetical protein